MFKFHIKGYLACQDKYYYDSKCPVDITVYAKDVDSAFKKADSVVGYIHRRTYTYEAEEILNYSEK